VLTIRPARRSDSGAIFEIHLKSLDGLDEESAEWFEALLRVRSRRRVALVAEVGGRVVGFAIAYRRGRVAYVDSIAVDPGYRGRGIGSELLSQLERSLRQAGVGLVALSVKDGNKRALDFYLRNGYALRGVVLILSCPVDRLPEGGVDGYVVRRGRAGSVDIRRRVKPSTWWSTLTEPVDRLVYRRYFSREEVILAYRGRRLRGLAEFSVEDELFVDYMALSSYSATDALRAVLSGLRAVGREVGASRVTIPVDSSKRLFIEQLLRSGFHTVGTEYLVAKELEG